MSYLSTALARRGDLAPIHHGILHLPAVDDLVIAHQRPLHRGVLDAHLPTQDAVRRRAADDLTPRFDRDVGPNRGILQHHAFFYVDGILDLDTGGELCWTAGAAMLEQVLVGLEQRIHLAAVVPAADFTNQQLLALVHHVLERVRQVKLAALPRRTLQDVLDPVEQRTPVLHVLQPDILTPRDRGAGFLHDLRHVALLVGHDHAEPLVIFDLLRPDDAVGARRFHDR